jgi:hypothetical protein
MVWMYYKKKGVLSTRDVGIADLCIKDEGLVLGITVLPVVSSGEIKLVRCDVAIKDLDVNIRESKHE